MKKILVIILLTAGFYFAQNKEAVEDTTAINNKIATLQQQYVDAGKVIEESQKRIEDMKMLRYRIEGFVQALIEQKKELFETKYKK